MIPINEDDYILQDSISHVNALGLDKKAKHMYMYMFDFNFFT